MLKAETLPGNFLVRTPTKRAGMYVALQDDTYEKELRPGEELSTQSVTV